MNKRAFEGPIRARAFALALLLCLSACERPLAPGKPNASAATSASTSGAAIAPWSGTSLRGTSRAELKRYLETVVEVSPSKFDVHWNPATVAFNRAAAIRALRGISQDGSMILLDPNEPAVAKLQPGSILWIWGVTVAKVRMIGERDGSTVVYTQPVPLNEAIPDGEIAFEAPVGVRNFLIARAKLAPPKPQSRMHPEHPGRRFMLVGLQGTAPEAADDGASSDADDKQALGDDAAFDGNAYHGSLKGYDFTIGYRPGSDGSLKLLLEAREASEGGGASVGSSDAVSDAKEKAWAEAAKSLHDQIRDLRIKMDKESARGPIPAADQQVLDALERKQEALDQQKAALKSEKRAAKELFEIAADNLDVRFKMNVDMQGFNAAANYLFKGGDIAQSSLQLKALSGTANVNFISRLGSKDTRGSKVPLMEIPIVFNVPMPVGGIPFVVQIGTDFLINVFLSGQHSALTFDGQYAFSGSSGLTYSKQQSSYDTNISGGEPKITGHQGWSPGPSAALVGVQLPRIGYGLGLFGASSVAYFDLVHVLTMTNGANVVIGPMPHCQRISYSVTGHVGIDTQIMPLPIAAVTDAVSNRLSAKKEVFKKEYELLDPPVKGCMVDGK